jgi:23S rRNA (uracil1939-C5)-methyltransferase
MSYEEELEFKRRKVEEALRRIGGVDAEVSLIHGAKMTDRYRNKVQFPVSSTERVNIGFYRARSHDVIDVDDCLLQPEEATRIRQTVKDWMTQFGISAYDERTHKGLLRHVYVRTNRKGESLCVLVVNGTKLPHEKELIAALQQAEPRLLGMMLSINRDKTNVILGDSFRTLWGQDYLEDQLCGLMFQLSPQSFYQVNREQTEVLYHRAMEFAQLTGHETVLDLYCGIGTITLAMAKQAGRVIGAEVVKAAVEDASENAKRNGVSNVEFICGDAGEVAEALAKRGEHPDVICVDPPRKGLALPVIESIVQMAPRRLVYVSCDPGTLARDVKLLEERGYHLEKAEACDLFPRTIHVETVILMTHCGKNARFLP